MAAHEGLHEPADKLTAHGIRFTRLAADEQVAYAPSSNDAASRSGAFESDGRAGLRGRLRA